MSFRFLNVQPLRARWVVAVLVSGAASTLLVHGQGSCGTQPNPIVCENALPGNPPSQWDLSPSPLSPPFSQSSGDNTIQGFATDISVNRGGTIHFKVDTTAPTFKIDIYRMGYYNGNGARLIATIPSVAGHNQPNCLTESSTGLIDCGDWTESAAWAVPSTVVSGIYFAKLTRTDSGGSSHVFFVVRDDASTSDLLFQTSDTTWQAYNDYGGNSLYVGGPGQDPARAYKVSYNRPFNTRGDSAQDFVFNAEYPMVRWIEANGYNVSYSSGVDTDRYGSLLLQHRVFLSVGHDEYWSGAQRTNVETARGAGVNLAFFSGNEVYWKTRWEPSIDGTATAYRTLVTYKETHASAVIDPQDPPTWTGTWRDPRFSPPADGGRPENALTGTIFTVNQGPSQGAINVTQQYSSQPFWRNTRVATLAPGASTTLTAGVLGYEWDENLNNGFRPAGLTQLSATTLSVPSKLTDYGHSYAAGTATHALTLYRHASGALVFGAGTIQWSWGLDGNHDRQYSTPDLAMQQAMVNLFSDMGSQPASLQPGLVSGTTDTTPPTVSMTAPASGSTVGGTAVTLSATAADNVGVAGVQFKLDGANLGTEDTVSPYSINWNTTGVANGTHTLTAVARDAAANQTTSISVSVTVSNTPDTTPPTVSMTAPADGATATGSAVTISATAADNVGVAGVQFLLDGVATGAEVTTAPYSIAWNSTATSNGTHTLSARARDAAGNTATATGVTVTVTNSPSAFGMDALAFGDRSSAAKTIATSAFSTTASNELLLAFVATDAISGTTTVSSIAGGSLTWQLVVRTNAQKGTSEVWRAFAAAPLSGITVTATLSQSVSSSITVVSFKGVDTSGTNGSGAIGATKSASANPGAPTATLTTTRAGSWVFGVGNDWDNAIARTLGGNQTMVHQFLSSVGDTYWVQRTTSPTPTSGTSVTINDTAPTGDRYNLSLVEVRPAPNSDTTPPTVSISAPAGGATISGTTAVSATASDNVAVAGVQFKLDGASLGAEDTVSPYSINWNTTGVANGAHSLTATARDAAGNVTTSIAVSVTVSNTPDTTPPTVSMTAPSDGGTVSGSAVAVSATSADNVGVAGVQFLLDGVAIGAEVTTAPYSILWNTTTATNSSHTLSARARDAAGNTATSAAVTVTVNNVDATPPVVSAITPPNGSTGVATSVAPTVRFSEAMNQATLTSATVYMTDATSAVVPTLLTYNVSTFTVTLMPAASLANSAAYNVVVVGGSGGVADLAGNVAAGTTTSSFTTVAASGCPCSIWSTSAVPERIEIDTNAQELGLKFKSDVAGQITAIRFYKGAQNTGVHTGTIWSSAGVALGTVTFSNETASGWQTATFVNPVPIAANTTYVVSYHTNVGYYGVTEPGLTVAVDNGPLHALADAASGGNGVYALGNGGVFPNQTWDASNYWVDIVFTQ